MDDLKVVEQVIIRKVQREGVDKYGLSVESSGGLDVTAVLGMLEHARIQIGAEMQFEIASSIRKRAKSRPARPLEGNHEDLEERAS